MDIPSALAIPGSGWLHIIDKIDGTARIKMLISSSNNAARQVIVVHQHMSYTPV